MELSNLSIPLSKIFFPASESIVGPERYDHLITRTQELFADFPFPANTYLRHHLVDGILPGLALYQILREEGLSQTDAIAILDQTLETLFAEKARQMHRIGRVPFVYPILRLVIKPMMKEYPAEGWQIEWAENSSRCVRFNMRSCFYHDTLSRLGAPELTASFCKVDDQMYGEMSRQIEWQRTQTIGRGDSLCNFCFANAARMINK